MNLRDINNNNNNSFYYQYFRTHTLTLLIGLQVVHTVTRYLWPAVEVKQEKKNPLHVTEGDEVERLKEEMQDMGYWVNKGSYIENSENIGKMEQATSTKWNMKSEQMDALKNAKKVNNPMGRF